MKRIGLVVAYDGTNYCGWQTQPNGITVQGVLNDTLSELLGEKIETIGASRTDAGVHALGNVAVFDTNTRIPGEKISYALNQRLPEDIRIQMSEEVELDFHPRYCDSEKTYEYRILNRTFRMPTRRLDTYFYHYPLDVEKMKKAKKNNAVIIAGSILAVIVFVCVFCRFFMTKDPTYMDLKNCNISPNKEFFFGTDTMGRDVFSMILYGGRISLFIGLISTVLSTTIAVIYGSFSGIAPEWIDELMMRFTEILLSIPSILLIIFLQALAGKNSVVAITIVIGLTSWMNIAKMVRIEVRQLRESEYLIAAKCMGGSFWHILRVHLLPNFVSSIMFMVVMNIRSAIIAESTLSFLGIGLPMEIISWGSMLSLSEKALMTNSWWIILIPGAFLVVTLLAITGLGDYLRKELNKKESYL